MSTGLVASLHVTLSDLACGINMYVTAVETGEVYIGVLLTYLLVEWWVSPMASDEM